MNGLINIFFKLNCKKTQVIVFGNRHFHSSFHFRSCPTDMGSSLPISRTVKFLGVYIDQLLTFDTHVSKLVASSYLILRNIRSISKFLDRKYF